MKLLITGDAKGLEVQLVINWKSLAATMRVILALITLAMTVLAAPEISRLGMLLGWW